MIHHLGNNLKYIIASTGRSGSVYFAKVLTDVGIPCSHERIFTYNGIVENGEDSNVSKWSGLRVGKPWAESSYMAAPFLNHPCLKGSTIIHVVREPVKVIQSFANKLQFWRGSNGLSKYEHFIEKHLPSVNQQSSYLLKNIWYVVEWNKLIESQVKCKKHIRVKLETDTDMLLDFLKIPPELRNINRNVANSYETWPKDGDVLDPKDYISEHEILNSELGEEVIKLSRRYGYER